MRGRSEGGGERWRGRQWGRVGVGPEGESLVGQGINLTHVQLLMGVGDRSKIMKLIWERLLLGPYSHSAPVAPRTGSGQGSDTGKEAGRVTHGGTKVTLPQ